MQVRIGLFQQPQNSADYACVCVWKKFSFCIELTKGNLMVFNHLYHPPQWIVSRIIHCRITVVDPGLNNLMPSFMFIIIIIIMMTDSSSSPMFDAKDLHLGQGRPSTFRVISATCHGWAMFQGIFRFPYLKNNGWYEVDAPERSPSDYQDKAPCEQQTQMETTIIRACLANVYVTWNMENWRFSYQSHAILMLEHIEFAQVS